MWYSKASCCFLSECVCVRRYLACPDLEILNVLPMIHETRDLKQCNILDKEEKTKYKLADFLLKLSRAVEKNVHCPKSVDGT